MTKLIVPILVTLLSACTSQNHKVLELADLGGTYNQLPFTQDQYTLTPKGFYIEKKDLKINGKLITFSVFYDRRKEREQLQSEYNTNQYFDLFVPAFIQHKGDINCQSNQGLTNVISLSEDMKELDRKLVHNQTDVTRYLCLTQFLTSK